MLKAIKIGKEQKIFVGLRSLDAGVLWLLYVPIPLGMFYFYLP